MQHVYFIPTQSQLNPLVTLGNSQTHYRKDALKVSTDLKYGLGTCLAKPYAVILWLQGS